MSAEQKSRVNFLLDLTNQVLSTKQTNAGTVPRHRVSAELFSELRSGGLSFLLKNFGADHPLYKEFDSNVRLNSPVDVERARGILRAVKAEIES